MTSSLPDKPRTRDPLPAKTGGFVHSLRALRHRDFSIFWAGAVLTNTGKWLTNLAVPVVIYQMTGSAVMVGMMTVFQYLPGVVLGPLGGSLADRFNRRWMMIFAQAGMMLATFTMWLAWISGVREPYAILCLVGLIAVFNGISIPSWQSLLNDLVPRKDLLSAVTLNSLQNNIAKSMGPAIAGVLMVAFGVDWAFLISAFSFLFVIAALLLIRTVIVSHRAKVSGGIVRQTADAARYSYTQRGIFVAMILSVLVGLAGNPVYGLTVVLGAEVYGVDPSGVGALNLALGLGAIFAAPLVSGWNSRVKISAVIGVGTVVYGAGLAAVGLGSSFILGMVALAFVGAASLAVIAGINTSIQMIVADHMRGRVMAVRHVIYTLSFPVGGLVQGWVADRYGVQWAMISAGAAMLLVVAVLALNRSGVRFSRLNDPHDAGPDGTADTLTPEAGTPETGTQAGALTAGAHAAR